MAQGVFSNQVDWYVTYDYTIAAGAKQTINAYGRFITLLENSNGSVNPRLQINGQRGGELIAGLSIELPAFERFNKMDLVNNGGSAMSVKVAISNGQIFDSRFVASSAIPTKSGGAFTSPAAATVVDAAAAAVIVAADADTKTVILQNNDAANGVWIGGADIDAANDRGTFLAAGAALILDTSAAIYAENISGANVDISISKIGQ